MTRPLAVILCNITFITVGQLRYNIILRLYVCDANGKFFNTNMLERRIYAHTAVKNHYM